MKTKLRNCFLALLIALMPTFAVAGYDDTSLSHGQVGVALSADELDTIRAGRVTASELAQARLKAIINSLTFGGQEDGVPKETTLQWDFFP